MLAFFAAAAAAWGETAFRLGDVVAVAYEGRLGSLPRQFGYFGAKDLAENLSKVIGRKVAFVEEAKAPADGVVVYVGDTRASRAAGIDAAPLRRGEWRLVTRPGAAYVVANTGLAANWGCTDFLERFADYWYLVLDMQDPFEVRPDRAVPCGDAVGRHATYWRILHCYGRRWPKTSSRNGANFSRRAAGRIIDEEFDPEWLPSRQCATNHSFFDYVPPEKYAKEHPEYYSMGRDGRRHFRRNNDSQLCFSNPAVFDIAYDSLVKFVEKDRAGKKKGEWPVIYDFSQMDNCGQLCLCDDCRKTIAKYNRKPGGHAEGGDAGLQMEFVNRLARKIRERYPDVIIRTFAYVSTDCPPAGDVAYEKNVMICLCDLYSQCDHQLPLAHPFNAKRRELIETWKRLAPHIEIWDYHLGAALDVSVDAIASDIRFFRSLGIDRIHDETHYTGSIFFTLNYFVAAQLYRDPSRDVEKMVERWCRIFGRGSDDMLKTVNFLRRIIRENPPTSAANWHARVLPYMNEANLLELLRMMKAAYAKETPGLCRGRISRAISETQKELLAIYRRTPGATAKYAKLRAEYVPLAKEGLAFADYDDAERNRELAAVEENLSLAELKFDDLPPAFDGVPEDEMHCLDWRRMRCVKEKSELVDDPLSSTGKVGRCRPEHKEFWARLNDNELYTNQNLRFHPLPDGKYHWLKVGTGSLARNSYIGFPYLNPVQFPLQQLYIECDGMPVNPNWYEFWVSCRQDGDMMYFDRLALKRVPPPASKNKNETQERKPR